ncbi:MAG: hypothetical protein ACOX6H_04355 [Christensenellales bacterium]
MRRLNEKTIEKEAETNAKTMENEKTIEKETVSDARTMQNKKTGNKKTQSTQKENERESEIIEYEREL